MLLVGGVATAKGGRARDFEFKPDGVSASRGARGAGNSQELTTWRRIGLSDQEIEQLNNSNTTRAEKDALIAKNDAVYKQLYDKYGKGNIFQDVKDNLPVIEAGNRYRIGDNSNVNLIDRVNITRKDGSLFATYVRKNGEWKLKM